MGSKVIVVGSSNTDMVVKTDRFPIPGESVVGTGFVTAAGGKGANQAVAARKAGAGVTFIACIGKDMFGDTAVQNFRKLGIDISCVVRDAGTPSGVALIFVDASGENEIVVALGSNMRLRPEHLGRAERHLMRDSILITQLEIPEDTVSAVARMIKKREVRAILNPAPARKVPRRVLSSFSIITPNETELRVLTGEKVKTPADVEKAARKLLRCAKEAVIVTMGKKGALVVTKSRARLIPAPAVKAVDTTAAGDAFNGALACALSEGKQLTEAVAFANCAASISVTRMGAQPSMPSRKEIERVFKRFSKRW